LSTASSSTSLLNLLSHTGVQVSIGPFLVRVRSDVPGVADHLRQLYTDFPMARADDPGHFDIAIVSSGGVRRVWRRQANLVINGARPFLPLPADIAGAMFEWAMNWCVGNRALAWVSVHAAVVERHGRALILSAESGAGKSTLCAALALAGWRLFSDEFALVDPSTLTVAPLPRPVSLKEASIEVIGRRAPDAVFSREGIDIEHHRFVHMRPPSDSVARAAQTAAPRWIVFPRYVAGRAPTTIAPLFKAHALMRLVDQSFNYNNLGSSGFTTVADLVRRSECYVLEYGDLDDALAALDSMTAV